MTIAAARPARLRIPATARLAAAGLALVAAVSAGSADAARIAPLEIGGWSGGAYSDDQTGSFSHCAASANYRSGVSLLFSVSNDEAWSMGFSSQSWSLVPGNRYPVQFRIDRGTVIDGVAVARNPKLAQVVLPANNRLFQSFRRGNILRVAAAKKVLEFRLTDTSKLLSRLLDCARHFAAKAEPDPFASDVTDPFSGTGGAQNARSSGPTPESRNEAATVARLLLEQANLRFEPMGPKDNLTLWNRNDAIWRMPGLYGALRIVDDRAASSAALQASIVASDRQSCSGQYMSGPVKFESAGMRDFYSACASGSENDLALYYALLPRKTGGFYLVTIAGTIADAKKIRAAGLLIAETARNSTGTGTGAARGQTASFTY